MNPVKAIVQRPLNDAWASNDRLLALVELSPDGIIVHDGECIVFANAAALHLVGAGHSNQIVRRPIEEFLEPPHLKAAQDDILGNSHWTKYAPPVRDCLKRLDGTELAVEVRALAFVDDGHPFIHLVIRDISERIIAEEGARVMEHRLQEAQRMEDVGALAGGVAHEVNNMMTVIMGFSQFLLDDGHLSDEARPDVMQITKAAERASVITAQLLAFSRRTATRPEVLDLSYAVTLAASTIQRILGSARVVVLNTEVHSNICIDPAHVEQVIVNLVLNARDATATGDTITISTDTIALAFGNVCAEGTVVPAGEYATLSVLDTGTGMTAETKRRIFEPFFTTKPVGKGTGLGLAAVIGLLRQSGCYINVSSAVNAGTEFMIYFPIDGTKSTNQRDRHQFSYRTAVSAPKGTVLFVDQEPTLRIIAMRALEEAGYSVVTAADSREAFALIASNGPPTVVVTDAMVASVGGSELARRLSLEWPSLPVILMTAYVPSDFYLGNDSHSAVGSMQKPFTPIQLVSAVAVAVARVSPVSAQRPTI
ncbi:MAG: ATP-binding protein [Gemmatimonas sp.]